MNYDAVNFLRSLYDLPVQRDTAVAVEAASPDLVRPSTSNDGVSEALGPCTSASLNDTGQFRSRAAHLIRQVREVHGRERAVAARDAMHERIAIATIDGGLNENEAEQVAFRELTTYLD